MENHYTAVDVETANADLASICQIGVVTFDDAKPVSTWETFVNPDDFFDGWNVSIHGITKEDVADAPTFPEIYDKLQHLMADRIVVSHMPFDRLAVTRAAEKYGFTPFHCTWLDSARVVRRAWPQFSQSGYALANCTSRLGIAFRHHAAAEDARAAGELVALAIQQTGLTVGDWLIRVTQPIHGAYPSQRISRKGNPDGPLAGQVIVFTGALTIPRARAADLAADAGSDVAAAVTKETTLLVVGEQDIRRLVGHKKSSKHRKAEALIKKGQPIRILGESDFQRLVGLSDQ